MHPVPDIGSTLPPLASAQALAHAHSPEEMREVKKTNSNNLNLCLAAFLQHEHKSRLVDMVLHNGTVKSQNICEKTNLTFKAQFSHSMSMHAEHAQGFLLTRRLPSSVLKACLYWLTPEEDESKHMKDVEPRYQGYRGFLALSAFLLLHVSSGDTSCNK